MPGPDPFRMPLGTAAGSSTNAPPTFVGPVGSILSAGQAQTGRACCSAVRPPGWSRRMLPRASALERLVARIRSRAGRRLWRTLTRDVTREQRVRLDALVIAGEGGRPSPLDRLRDGPNLRGIAELSRAIGRLDEVRVLTLGLLFDIVVTALSTDAAEVSKRARLRTLRDLDACALQLRRADGVLMDEAMIGNAVREAAFAIVPRVTGGGAGTDRRHSPTAGQSLFHRAARPDRQAAFPACDAAVRCAQRHPSRSAGTGCGKASAEHVRAWPDFLGASQLRAKRLEATGQSHRRRCQ